MLVNPAKPFALQGKEEPQGENMEGAFEDQELTFQNTLSEVQGESGKQSAPFHNEEELLQHPKHQGNQEEPLQATPLPLVSMKSSWQSEEPPVKTSTDSMRTFNDASHAKPAETALNVSSPVDAQQTTQEHKGANPAIPETAQSTAPIQQTTQENNKPNPAIQQTTQEHKGANPAIPETAQSTASIQQTTQENKGATPHNQGNPPAISEATLRTTPINPIANHAQLTSEEGTGLKNQIANMPQPEALGELKTEKAPIERTPSSANIGSVLKVIPPEQPAPFGRQEAIQSDPRIPMEPVQNPPRPKVTIESQLEQANFQLEQKNTETMNRQVDDPSTEIVLKHSVAQDTSEEALLHQLRQQFRTISTEERLAAKNPQSLKAFSPSIYFDPAKNPDLKPQTPVTNNALRRNVAEISEIFTSSPKERIETTQTFSELDANWEQVGTQPQEKGELTKTGRLLSENATRAELKGTAFDLDQIMSKVNMKEDGNREMTLQLKPEALGELKMKIHQKGNELSVEMLVATPEIKQILEANLPELRARFLAQEEAAFDQLQFAVDVEQHSFSEQGQGTAWGEFEEDYAANQQKQEMETELPVSEKYRRAGYHSGVSVYV